MSAKITKAQFVEAIKELREKMRKLCFMETIKLKIGLKDYDSQKDKQVHVKNTLLIFIFIL